MSKINYNGPDVFKPLSPWAYFGLSILFSLPVVGFIFLIIFSVSDAKSIAGTSRVRIGVSML